MTLPNILEIFNPSLYGAAESSTRVSTGQTFLHTGRWIISSSQRFENGGKGGESLYGASGLSRKMSTSITAFERQ